MADEPTAVPDDVVWADAVLFGTPTRFGNVASQLKQFIDTLGPQWGEGMLADKTYAGFTAAKTEHGGHESTLLALYNTIHHFGGIVVPPGYTDEIKFEEGNPYGVSQVDQGDPDEPLTDTASEALTHLVERLVSITAQPEQPALEAELVRGLPAHGLALLLRGLLQLRLEVDHLLLQVGITRRQDAYGEQAGVAGIADRHRRDGHPGRHLHDGEQRVHAVEVLQRHRHPDHRQRRHRGEHARAGGPLPRHRR